MLHLLFQQPCRRHELKANVVGNCLLSISQGIYNNIFTILLAKRDPAGKLL